MLHRVSTRLWMSAGLTASLALGSTASADFIYTLNNTPGLISHWSLNETTGNTVYDSVTDDAIDGANNGTFGAGASLNAAGPNPSVIKGGNPMIGFSPSNTAMDFDGSATQALVMDPTKNPSFTSLTEASLGMWFSITGTANQHYYLGGYARDENPAVWGTSNRYALAMNHSNNTNGLLGYGRFQNPSTPGLPHTGEVGRGTDAVPASGGVYRGDEEWHYAVLTLGDVGSDKHTNLYVDGELISTAPLGTSGSNIGAAGAATWNLAIRNYLQFGVDPGASVRVMVGQLDEISIFDRALTASEVSALYASAFQPLQVPEPSTICMVLAAAAGALVWRRRMA